jgi:hypothetical protein
LKFNFLSNVSSTASCLANVPTTFNSFFRTEYIRTKTDSEVLLGQLYSLSQQCRLIYGSFSHYCNGVSIIL